MHAEDLLLMSKMHLDQAEVFLSSSSTTSLSLFEGELDNYEMAQSGGLGFRGIKDGRIGYSYSESLDASVYPELINDVLSSLEVMEEKEELFDGKISYPQVNKKELIPANPDDVLKSLQKLEKLILESPQIAKVPGIYYQEIVSSTRIHNTLGLSKTQESGAGILYAMAAAEKEGEMYTGKGVRIFYDFSCVDLEDLAREIIEDTLSCLGAQSIPSGDYRVFIDKEAFDSLLGSFSSIFNAELVQKGLSLLKGKVGERIASEKVNLVMAPLDERAPLASSFDGEGYPTQNFNLIEKGILKSFYHNLATAKKEGVTSTGNASRSYRGKVGLSPNFLVLEEGEKSEKELIASMDKGVHITELMGFHSGLNPTSGDFSLPASGYYIEGGKRIHPVNQILLSGNFFTLLEDILELSSEISSESLSSRTPGALIDKLSIGGK
ncbi:MAG: TldD/PmbA family protein [Tissierellia bacterium]|nr:TldD/PmbA family protein [Tissierellia bacterium]